MASVAIVNCVYLGLCRFLLPIKSPLHMSPFERCAAGTLEIIGRYDTMDACPAPRLLALSPPSSRAGVAPPISGVPLVSLFVHVEMLSRTVRNSK